MNAHWKSRFWNHIGTHPIQWLNLMLRKSYYFLNSYEQYDNKTYSFHKARHPHLRYNPIHWGALLTLAVLGALAALEREEHRKIAIAAMLAFAIYAAGTILFYTSNRFRVPMLPLLAILASGGICTFPQKWIRSSSKLWQTAAVGCAAVTLLITYSGFFDARSTNTWEEDQALLANAAIRVEKTNKHATTPTKSSQQTQTDSICRP